ncbi:NAD(P)-dependent dehydrogenase (short-subunit alcohol dehydrogenase family) [Promicromonospora sp. AC04]|uniref:SDR family oxidoreductase n=1 Tax=Promicromonospora sp. AC04 TaxID=2135723 RepID=UPI000D4962AC|nr:SDR family oxidoreductase [Promicromonospora sp. AC04]PUB24372.1 NAD(P)-dependent dehydrogenase (short-subunit alcohol dehydrogenase family) [Promicromonospora sp. AC04]
MSHRPDMQEEVVVVTGAGGMGEAIARRIGTGRRLLLADYSDHALQRAVQALDESGYAVTGVVTDVSDRASVDRLAKAAADAGRLVAVVHTAGVSAATATLEQVLAVDLVGTAHVIDAFEEVAAPGLVLVCIASMAGHYAQLTGQQERELATTPAGELRDLPVVQALADPMQAYILAKRANQVRVQAAALAWNLRGARVNTVSPGVISTAMAKAEAASASGSHMLGMLDACGIGRMGSTGELAEAVAFLVGPGSRYVTGTDLLVDGGQAAWIRHHMPVP